MALCVPNSLKSTNNVSPMISTSPRELLAMSVAFKRPTVSLKMSPTALLYKVRCIRASLQADLHRVSLCLIFERSPLLLAEIFCNAVNTCGCGICAGSLESYLDCDVYKRWFGECEISCEPENNNSRGNDVANQEGSASGSNNRILLASVLGVLLSGLFQWPSLY
jgi:hypothetical protein